MFVSFNGLGHVLVVFCYMRNHLNVKKKKAPILRIYGSALQFVDLSQNWLITDGFAH